MVPGSAFRAPRRGVPLQTEVRKNGPVPGIHVVKVRKPCSLNPSGLYSPQGKTDVRLRRRRVMEGVRWGLREAGRQREKCSRAVGVRQKVMPGCSLEGEERQGSFLAEGTA